MNAKENYLTMLRGEIPEYVPSMFEPRVAHYNEEWLTPVYAPNGPVVTKLGVTYVGSKDLNNGAMPMPGVHILEDITKWRDCIHTPDTGSFDWEAYYKEKTKDVDRKTQSLAATGGDYFLTLISFMGFENAMLALYEEPEEVKALLEYVSEFYIEVLKQQIRWLKPDTISIMDDDAALRAPFFSVEMYREFFKPYQQKHCDLARENGILLERHDCGRSEQFVPDWVEMGIRSWNPAQTTNDLVSIKKKDVGKLALCGAWDSMKWASCENEEEYRAALKEYVDTFAPGGGFTYSAMVGGKPEDPLTPKRRELVREVYDTYARDYYKTH